MNKAALIVVDVQNDFAHPDGSLYVKGGDKIVPAINELIHDSQVDGSLVVFTRDYHPPVTDHFNEYGGPWPSHCVLGSWGSEYHDGLYIPAGAPEVLKGMHAGEDGYSGFYVERDGDTKETKLHSVLQEHGVEFVDIVGIAFDVCVKATALDAVRLGYDTAVFKDETASVFDTDDEVIAELRAAGVQVI